MAVPTGTDSSPRRRHDVQCRCPLALLSRWTRVACRILSRTIRAVEPSFRWGRPALTLIFLSIGWLAGLYLGLASGDDARAGRDVLLLLVAPAAMAALLGREDRQLRVTALSVVAGLMGIWRALSVVPDADPMAPWVGSSVTVQGTVAGRPELRDSYQSLVLDVDRLRHQGGDELVRGRLLVRTDRFRQWSYGNRVVARGVLSPVPDGSGYWAVNLARQGIHATLEYPFLQLAERPPGSDAMVWVNGIRDRLEQLCAFLLPEPQASLLAGILVGSRVGMPADFQDALRATSTTHIVAVSGFNVTVVAGVAQLAALRFLARRPATLLAILAVWLYSLLTGLPPSAFRAALMATMSLSAILVGRGGDALSFLLFSAAIMVGLDPPLIYDLGFQLSFLATAGLVLLEPVLRRWLRWLPGWLASSLSVTLAAQLFTLPVLVDSFHTLSLVSPLTNLLVTTVLPGLMVVGGLTIALGALFQPLGQLLAPLAWLYLTYLVDVISWTSRLPGAVLSIGSLGYGLVSSYYLVMLAVSLWPMPEMKRVRGAIGAAGRLVPPWMLVGAVAAVFSLGLLSFSGRPDGRMHLYFLDVGHGDATLIRSGAGHWILVDGGPSPMTIVEALGRRQGILDRGLDGVVLTGYGEERLAGMLEVARRQPVGFVLQPGFPPAKGAGKAWSDLLQERGIPVVRAVTGQRIPLDDDGWLEVLWAPGENGADGEPELALKVVSGGVSVLLPGDLSRVVQTQMARSSCSPVDLLRVPRHGAAGALDEQFLRTIAPRVAVLSVGANNRFGHPAEATLEMLKSSLLLRTDLNGTIEMTIGRDGYELFTDR